MRLSSLSLLLATMLFSLLSTARAQSFAAAPVLQTPQDPVAFASADFNGDGKPDLAYADSTNTVTIWLGNGNGTFTAGQSIPFQLNGQYASKPPLSGNVSAILTADVNGDGKPDLVVLSEWNTIYQPIPVFFGPPQVQLANVVQIDTLLGNGDGTFQPAKTSNLTESYIAFVTLDTTGEGFPAVGQAALADFNGDGKLDIAIPDPHNGLLVVLAGNGAGLFEESFGIVQKIPSSPISGNGPGLVIAADLNGDKHQDLVVLTQGTDQNDLTQPQPVSIPGVLSIYLGKGDGSFNAGAQISATAMSVLVADMNGDGIPDLVTTQSDFGVQILTGNGDGTFTAQPEIPSTNGARLWVAGVADYDGDGFLDIALIGQDGLCILLGQGGGSYAAPVNYPAGGLVRSFQGSSILPESTYGQIPAAIFADFNGDGNKDFAVRGSDGFTMLLGNGDGTFQSAAPYELNHISSGIDTTDFNLDGNADVAAAVGPGATRILLGKGDGTLSIGPDPAPGTPNPTGDGTLRAGDFNGNGLIDVMGVQNGAWTQFGDGSGNLGAPNTVPDTSTVPCCGAVGDFNNDGLSDIALVDQDHAYFLTNLGGGHYSTFTLPLPDPYPPEWDYLQRAVALGDFNGDGNVDAAIVTADFGKSTEYVPESLRIFLGNGDGTFDFGQEYDSVAKLDPANLSKPSLTTLFAPTIADLNGDGKPDIILPGTGSLQILYGNGDGSFQAPVAFTAPTSKFTVADVTDFNLDGVPDLVLSDFGEVSLYCGKKGGGFTAPVSYAAGDWPGHPVITDLNGDGATDLVFASGTDAVVLLNIPPPGSFPAHLALVVTPEPSAYKQPFSITATLTPVHAKNGKPTGSVTFSVDGTPLDTVQLAGGVASTIESAVLTPGRHKITASYSGDAVFRAINLSVEHLVLGVPNTISLTGAPDPANLGQNVTFTAHVAASTPGIPTPSGKVQFLFLDGVTPEMDATLDANGTAAITMFFVASGTHALKAHYLGDTNYGAGNSNTFNEYINPGPGDFTLSVSPMSTSVQDGQSATFTVTMTSLYGFNQNVNLSCTGPIAADITCTFLFNPVAVAPYLNITSPSGSTTMTVTTVLPHAASLRRPPGHWKPAGALLAGILLFMWPRRWRARGLWLVLLASGILAFQGCNSGPVILGTPFGTSTLTVTATAAQTPSVTHSVPITITVH